MSLSSIATFLAVGVTFLVATTFMVLAGHFWKPRYFKKCLFIGVLTAVAGLLLEATSALGLVPGLTIVIMATPLFYLCTFHLARLLFLNLYDTEPYVTSRSSGIGSAPTPIFNTENYDGPERKFRKGRKVMGADFVFSLLTHLIPALVLLWLVAWISGRL